MFKKYDRDQNGTFDAFELRDLMRALGTCVAGSLSHGFVVFCLFFTSGSTLFY